MLALFQGTKQTENLRGYLGCYLVRCLGGFLHSDQSVMKRLEHKFYEVGGFALRICLSQTRIICILPVTDDSFYRQVGQYRLPLAQDKRLSESPHTSVAVIKRMDEFKLVVKNAARNQRVFLRVLQPSKYIFQVSTHQLSRGGHVHDGIPPKHTNAACAQFTGAVNKVLHE